MLACLRDRNRRRTAPADRDHSVPRLRHDSSEPSSERALSPGGHACAAESASNLQVYVQHNDRGVVTACEALCKHGDPARCASQAQLLQTQPQRCACKSCTRAHAATHFVRAQIGYTPYSYMSGDQGRYLAPGITVVTDTTYGHPWRYEHVQPPNRVSWVAARARDGSTRSFLGPVRHQHQVCLACTFKDSTIASRQCFHAMS